jgi:hypothetical protein
MYVEDHIEYQLSLFVTKNARGVVDGLLTLLLIADRQRSFNRLLVELDGPVMVED